MKKEKARKSPRTPFYGAFRGLDSAMLDAIPFIDRDIHSTCAMASARVPTVAVASRAVGPLARR